MTAAQDNQSEVTDANLQETYTHTVSIETIVNKSFDPVEKIDEKAKA